MGYGIELAKAAGGQAAGNFINEGMGLLFQGLKNKQQLKQAGKLQELEIKGSKELTDYNMMKQLQMWKDTSYPTQVEMLEKAGLNPALMYGMGGGGGVTTGSPGHVSGQGAGTAQRSGGSESMGLQTAMLAAQVENIKADTELKKADAGIKPLQGENIKSDTEGKHLNNEFLRKSLDDRLDAINSDALIKIEELNQSITKTGLDRATVIQKADQIKAQAAGEILKNMLIEAQTRSTGQSIEESKKKVMLMDAEISKMSEEIAQGWSNLDRQERELKLKKWVEQIKAKYPGVWNVFGRMLNDTGNAIGDLMGNDAISNNPPKTDK